MLGKGQAAGPSTALEGLPEELSEFLSKDTYSLLIKGESGTGKTILALSILKSLIPVENPLYLSTRTSPLQLVENYPWVEDIFGPPNTAKVSRGKDVEGWETLVDARLDEPNTVFERITNVLMDKDAPTVVIDSWESMSDTLGSEALRTNIKVLQTWRERAGARFIFVGEDPSNTAIDYMVEGVVVLRDKVAEGKRLREIVLSKLHGVQIERPSYFFTLHDGSFASIPGYSPRDYEFRNPIPVRFDRPFKRSRSRTPTGYASLDSHLDGGLRPQSMAVVEVDRRVDARAGLILLSRMVQDWLATGGRVELQKPETVDSRFLRQYAKSFAAGRGELRLTEETGGHSGGAGRKAARTLAIRCNGAGRARPHGNGAEVTVSLGRKEEIGRDLEKSTVHLRLVEIEGTLFLRCDVPPSALFAVVPALSGGNPIIRLEPVV